MKEKLKEYLKYIITIFILLIIISIIVIYYYINNKDEEIKIKENKEILAKKEDKKEEKEETFFYVDIKGAVNNEGVYKLKENSRVIDVINEAGGLKENADTSIINLSKKIFDEMFIVIYTKEEIDKYKQQTISTKEINEKLDKNIIVIDENNNANVKNNKKSSVKTNNNETIEEENKLVNINTATKEELLTITGIGESKADAIISYREENGDFENIEDIKNVSGIGDSLFEKIKEYITV
ncbi:MAG: helix-hairpin-helix domain-containing protein [Bacilli bacterium]|nr:helix-hairpin-helix domain-containing protein [Bacilli bacterium]